MAIPSTMTLIMGLFGGALCAIVGFLFARGAQPDPLEDARDRSAKGDSAYFDDQDGVHQRRLLDPLFSTRVYVTSAMSWLQKGQPEMLEANRALIGALGSIATLEAKIVGGIDLDGVVLPESE